VAPDFVDLAETTSAMRPGKREGESGSRAGGGDSDRRRRDAGHELLLRCVDSGDAEIARLRDDARARIGGEVCHTDAPTVNRGVAA
jgi:hypothetical protein